MKKIILISSIVILGALAVYFTLIRGNSTLGVGKESFSLENTDEITSIYIEDGNENLELFRDGGQWKAEGNEIENRMVADLLMVSQQLEIVAPMPISLEDSIKDCLVGGKTVEYYSGDKLLLSYTLCRYHQQLFARRKGSKKIFRVAARGFSSVDLTAMLMTDPDLWHGKIILNLKPDEIRLVNLQYPAGSKQGFVIYTEEKKLALKGSDREFRDSEINRQAIEDYLHFFNGIPFEEPDPNQKLLDYLAEQEPFFSLQLLTSDSQSVTLAGFRLPGNNVEEYDSYRFCGISREGNLMYLEYMDFDPILAELEDFLIR